MYAGSWEDSSDFTQDKDETSNVDLVKKRPPPRPARPPQPPRPSAPPRPAPINLKATSRSTSPSAQPAAAAAASTSPNVGHHITSANKKAHKIITSLKHKAGLKSPKHFVKDKKKHKSPIPSPSKELVEPTVRDKSERSEEWLALQQMLDRTKETVIKTKQNLSRLTSKDESDNLPDDEDEDNEDVEASGGLKAKQGDSEEVDEEAAGYTNYPDDSSDKSPEQLNDISSKEKTGGSVQDLLGLGLGDFESPPEADDWLSSHKSKFERDFLAAEEENLTLSTKSVTDELVDSFLGLDPSTSLKPSPAISPALSPVSHLPPESESDPFVVPKIADPFDVSSIVIKTESDPFIVKSTAVTPSDPFAVSHDPFVTTVDSDSKSSDPFAVNPTLTASSSTDPFTVTSDPVPTTHSYSTLEDPFSVQTSVPRATPDSLSAKPQTELSSSDPFIVSPACTESLFLGSNLGSSTTDILALSPGLPKSGSELFSECSDLTPSHIDPFTPSKEIFNSAVDLFTSAVSELTTSITDPFTSATEPKSPTVDIFSSTIEVTSSTVDPFTTITEVSNTTTDPFFSTTEVTSSSGDPFTKTTEVPSTTTDPFFSTTEITSTEGDPFTRPTEVSNTTTDPFFSTTEVTSSSGDPFTTATEVPSATTDPFFSTTEVTGTASDPFTQGIAFSGKTEEPFTSTVEVSSSEVDPFASTAGFTSSNTNLFDENKDAFQISSNIQETKTSEFASNQLDDFFVGKTGAEDTKDSIFSDNIAENKGLETATVDPFASTEASSSLTQQNLEFSNFANFPEPEGFLDSSGTIDSSFIHNQRDKLASTPEPYSTVSEPLDFASIALVVKAVDKIAVSSEQTNRSSSPFTTISEPLDFHSDDNSYKLEEKSVSSLENNSFCTNSEPIDLGTASFINRDYQQISEQPSEKPFSPQTDPFATVSEPVDVQLDSSETPFGWSAFSDQLSSASDSDLNTQQQTGFGFTELSSSQDTKPFETAWPTSVATTDIAFSGLQSNSSAANMSAPKPDDAFPLATDSEVATQQPTEMTTSSSTITTTTTQDSSLLTMEVTDLAAGSEETDASLKKGSAEFIISDEAFSTTFGSEISATAPSEILAPDMPLATDASKTFSLIDDTFTSTPAALDATGENVHCLTDPFAEGTFTEGETKTTASFSASGFPTTNSAFPMLEPSTLSSTTPFSDTSFPILAPQTTPVPPSFTEMDSQEVPDISKTEISQNNPFDNIDPDTSIHVNVKNPFSMFETIEDDSPFGQSVDNKAGLIQPEVSEDIAARLNAFLQPEILPETASPIASSTNIISTPADGTDSKVSMFTEPGANPFVDQNDTPAVADAEFFDEDFFNTKTAEKNAEGSSAKSAWGAMDTLDKDSAFNPFQDDNFDAENIPQNMMDGMESQETAIEQKNPFLSSDFSSTAMIGETTINPFLSQVEELEKAQSSLSDNLSIFLGGKGEDLPIDPTSLPIDVFDPFKTIEPDDIPETSGAMASTSSHTQAVDSSDDDKESPDMDDNKDAFKLTIRMREPVEAGPSVALPPPPKVPKSPQMAPRINPFDRDSPPEENFAKFEVMETEEKGKEARTETQMSVSTTESGTPEEEEKPLEPLERFNPKMEEDGWTLMLRQPTKKKLTGNRFWKTIYVRLAQQNDGPVLKLYNSKDDKDSFQELPLQPCYSLSEIALQHYDQYGKIHTLKIQYIFYRERVGIRTEKITPTFVKNMKPKANMILDHAPQISELLKFGSLNEQTIITFVQEVEDALMGIVAHREKTLSYQKDEVIVDVIDEYRAEINTSGHIENQSARVRIFCLSFVTGMPFVELGVNDKRRKGREVVGRHDIIPIKTEEWIKPENIEFHCSAKPEEYEKDGTIKFHPLDACHFELMRFRVRLRDNRELPLIVRVFRSIKDRHVEYRCDVVCTGYHAYSKKHGQFPCEDIEIRFPIPDCWIYLFRYEKRFGYGSFKSATRKPGKIKGLERLTMMAQGGSTPALLEASVGTAKYENVYHAIVWRISRLPERNQGAYKTHLFTLRLDLGPHDEVPDSLGMVSDVKFTMPASTISKCQIRSISCGNPTPPEKWVRYIAHYNYKVAIEHTLEGNMKNIPDIDVQMAADTNDSESDS